MGRIFDWQALRTTQRSLELAEAELAKLQNELDDLIGTGDDEKTYDTLEAKNNAHKARTDLESRRFKAMGKRMYLEMELEHLFVKVKNNAEELKERKMFMDLRTWAYRAKNRLTGTKPYVNPPNMPHPPILKGKNSKKIRQPLHVSIIPTARAITYSEEEAADKLNVEMAEDVDVNFRGSSPCEGQQDSPVNGSQSASQGNDAVQQQKGETAAQDAKQDELCNINYLAELAANLDLDDTPEVEAHVIDGSA
jgi:hypothetical protein